MDTLSTADRGPFVDGDVHVKSECGKLDIVLMHRPGSELLRLTKDNLQHLLYDALPNITETHKSHDIFTKYLREHGIHVLYLTQLLGETLAVSDEARHLLIDGIVSNHFFANDHEQEQSTALRQWLLSRNIEQLAQDVIAGVACSQEELGTSYQAQILLKICDPNTKFIVPPLPNLLFMRDAFSIIEKNVFIWNMAKAARQNEPLILRVIFQYHPQLSTSGLKIVEWQTTNNGDETIEGGDIAYLGQGVLLIGCSERTSRASIEAVARTGLFHQVIAVIIPPQRDYMHLDTILSSVGKHAFTLHGLLGNSMEVFMVKAFDDNNNILPKPNWISHGSNVYQAFRKLLNDSELVFYDAEDEETSIIEQREYRHNVVVVDNYHVVTYAGSDPKKGIVAKMTLNNACRVGEIPRQGLSEGGGGAHYMTNAIRRRAI